MATNILVLAAAGQGTPLDKTEAGYPVCLTEHHGISVLERIIVNTSKIASANYTFSLLANEADQFHLDRIVALLVPNARIVRTPATTRGSACTALLAACQLPENNGLLIVSANELVDTDLSEVVKDFQHRDLDAGTLIFRSIHPRFSYVRLNAEQLVVEAAQQNPISQHATAGVFWFRYTNEFVEAVKNTIRKKALTGDKFFVAPTLNELILQHKRIGIWNLDTARYFPLKTDRQILKFEQG